MKIMVQNGNKGQGSSVGRTIIIDHRLCFNGWRNEVSMESKLKGLHIKDRWMEMSRVKVLTLLFSLLVKSHV